MENMAGVVSFEVAAPIARVRRDLRAEAAALIEAQGHNLYSNFLIRHGRRPERREAAAIGRLMGQRVRASDGSLQPRPSKADKAAIGRAKSQRQKDEACLDQIVRLRCALANLSANQDDPAEVIQYIDPLFDDSSLIREQLAHAVDWLNRFAKEWGLEQESRGGPQSV
jgi:hypothetical protein